MSSTVERLPKITDELQNRWEGDILLLDGDCWTQDAVDFACLVSGHNTDLIEQQTALLREAVGHLQILVTAVGNMKVPQNKAEAGLQIVLTIGPQFEAARAFLAKAGL